MKRNSHLRLAVSLLAVFGIGYSAMAEPANPAYDMSAADTHWAFAPLVMPEVPSIDIGSGNAVDAFIVKKLQENGLNLNRPADKRSLIRRITYNLTGLPPSYEEVQSFVADTSADAYENLVERLLASPAYGERWGRHWLDVARYADSRGRPNFRPGNRYKYAHTYRDYVINAFNEDKPYDQFILEQIAADHLDLEEDSKELAALGFLTLGRSLPLPKDAFIDDQIDVITRGLQGLTVTCARCHDHKFDPIPTNDYYSLHGIFNSSDIPGELPVIQRPKNEGDYQSYLAEVARIQKKIDSKAEEVIEGWLLNERLHAGNFLGAYEEGRTITEDYPFTMFAGINGISKYILRLWIEYLDTEEGRAHPVLKDWFETYAESDPEAGIMHYNQLFKDALNEELDGYQAVRSFLAEPGSPLNPDLDLVKVWLRTKIREPDNAGNLMKELEAIEWTHPGTPFRAHVIADGEDPKDSPVYKRGNRATPGEIVPRQFLQILSNGEREHYTNGSGRLDLARDIVNPENPLTARVFVNRVWGWHLGDEFVDTPSDFGVRTAEPVHIDLLNWLSVSFVDSGWSMKALHRMIVLSNTYRQSSTPNSAAMAADPENVLRHHFPTTRLDFESMRDTVLAVSGDLDRTLGGVQTEILDPTSNRRTVYSFLDRSEPPGVFQSFDRPDPSTTSPKRFETIVPQQALFFMNSPFILRQAELLARRIDREASDDTEDRIHQYYRVVFQRDPSPEELQTGIEFIRDSESTAGSMPQKSQTASDAEQANQGWELYAQGLLLSNELIYLD